MAQALINLQDTTAEIRVRGALALLMLFAALASHFGLEAILGAFLAGATMKALDRDDGGTHLLFPVKLRAFGYGAFVPFFFVVTGMTLDVRSLLHPAIVARVPVFLLALLVARAAPVVLYRAHPPRELLAGGLFQATSLSVPVVGGAIGVDLGLLTAGNYAALVAAGLLSVIVFPALALAVLPSSTPTAPETSAGNAAAPA